MSQYQETGCEPYYEDCPTTTTFPLASTTVATTTTVPVTTTTACDDCFPVTGADVVPLSLIAFGAIAIGGAMVRLSRRGGGTNIGTGG